MHVSAVEASDSNSASRWVFPPWYSD